MKHTETPYKILRANDFSFFITTEKFTDCEEGYIIAKTTDMGKEAEANAEFIVRACNAHDALVEACKLAHEIISLNTQKHGLESVDDNVFTIIELLESALNKAKGE